MSFPIVCLPGPLRSSTWIAARRGSRTSSAQRIALPPFGPFSSVNVARALVGVTGSAPTIARRRSATRGRIAPAAFIDQVGAEQGLATWRRQRAQPRQRIGFEQAVGIDERQPCRRHRQVGQRGNALVAAHREAGIVRVGDEAHARLGHRGYTPARSLLAFSPASSIVPTM